LGNKGYAELDSNQADEEDPARRRSSLAAAPLVASHAQIRPVGKMSTTVTGTSTAATSSTASTAIVHTKDSSDLLKPYDVPVKDTVVKIRSVTHRNKGLFNEQGDWPAAPELFSAVYVLINNQLN